MQLSTWKGHMSSKGLMVKRDTDGGDGVEVRPSGRRTLIQLSGMEVVASCCGTKVDGMMMEKNFLHILPLRLKSNEIIDPRLFRD